MLTQFLYIAVLSIFPAGIWALVYLFLNTDSDASSFKKGCLGISFGILSMIPVLLLQLFWVRFPELNFFRTLQLSLSDSPFLFYSYFFIFVAVLEESLKAFAIVALIRFFSSSFNQLVDGIILGAFVALGFSFAENIFYFLQMTDGVTFSADFIALFNLRSFGTMLSHTIFSGTFGLFYAMGYFASYPHSSRVRKSFPLRFLSPLFSFFPLCKNCDEVRRYSVVFEGFLIAVALHFVFNMLLKLDFGIFRAEFFSLPLLVFSSLWLWSSFFDRDYLRVISLRKF